MFPTPRVSLPLGSYTHHVTRVGSFPNGPKLRRRRWLFCYRLKVRGRRAERGNSRRGGKWSHGSNVFDLGTLSGSFSVDGSWLIEKLVVDIGIGIAREMFAVKQGKLIGRIRSRLDSFGVEGFCGNELPTQGRYHAPSYYCWGSLYRSWAKAPLEKFFANLKNERRFRHTPVSWDVSQSASFERFFSTRPLATTPVWATWKLVGKHAREEYAFTLHQRKLSVCSAEFSPHLYGKFQNVFIR